MMTSGTGKPGSRRAPGFTLIEIIIVISILVVLASLVFVASQSIYRRAKVSATRAQIQKLKLVIDQYFSITGHYPPDGLDTPVKNDEGVEVRSSAALYQALSQPFEYVEMAGGIPQVRRHPPMLEFYKAEITDENPDYPGVHEIVDAFLTPIHYDNTENGMFRPQGGEVHYPPIPDEDHPADPRTLPEEEGGVPLVNEVQSSGYDLWSHGVREHEMSEGLLNEQPIATWNLSKD